MAEPHTETVDVLVVGAGPVGLTVAHELRRRGVRVRLIDRAHGPAATSRALATHARTLEIYEQMGILADVLPRGQRVVHFSLHRRGRLLVRFDTNYAGLPTRYPFSLMVDQVITEAVLRERVRALDTEVEWETELTGLSQDADGVTATLRGPDGATESVRVPWLVGTDGGHSRVRTGLGLRLRGERTETWLNADMVLTGDDLLPHSNHLLDTETGSLLLVPFPEPGKWRVVDTVDVQGADDWELIRARLEHKISTVLARPVRAAPASWVSTFTVQQRMVDRMRVGRCFVAGDAAHVHSPASGQGMNTGIQDGYNLAWKLAEVIRGHAGEQLLDTYGAERVPIGRKLLSSTRTATGLVALRNAVAPVLLPLGTRLLNAVHPVKRRIESRIIRGFCGLSLHYRDSPLTRVGHAARSPIRPGDRVNCDLTAHTTSPGWRTLTGDLSDPRWKLLVWPVGPAVIGTSSAAVRLRVLSDARAPDTGAQTLADPDGAVRAALGLRIGDCALIRPDGYLAGTAPAPDDAALSGFLAGFGLLPAAIRPMTTEGAKP